MKRYADLISTIRLGSGGQGVFRTQGGGANRRRPISAAACRGNPLEFTNLGAPGLYSSEAKVWEGLHIMRDPPEATPRHKEVRSEEGTGCGDAGHGESRRRGLQRRSRARLASLLG